MTAFNREQDTRGGMLNSSVFHMPVTVGVQEGNGTKLPVLIASWSPKEGQNTYNCHCSNDDTVFPRNAVSFQKYLQSNYKNDILNNIFLDCGFEKKLPFEQK